jgi:hypothetical protein
MGRVQVFLFLVFRNVEEMEKTGIPNSLRRVFFKEGPYEEQEASCR